MTAFLTPEATAFLGLILCWTLCPIVAGLLLYAGAVKPHQRILTWSLTAMLVIVWIVLLYLAPQLMRQYMAALQGAN